MVAPLSALCERGAITNSFILNSCSYNGEIRAEKRLPTYSRPWWGRTASALNDDYNNFSRKTNFSYHISEPIIGRFFPNLVPVRSIHFGAVSLIHSAPQRNAATLRKVLAPFAVSHVIAIDSCSHVPFYLGVSLSLFFLFLDFIAISDCVFNNKNDYSTRACWIWNNYNHFGAMRLVGYHSYWKSI